MKWALVKEPTDDDQEEFWGFKGDAIKMICGRSLRR